MNYAVDREQILETIALGAGRVTTQVVPTNSLAYVPELDERYPYDPDQARALLEEAGFGDGFEFTRAAAAVLPDVHGGASPGTWPTSASR